MAMILPTPVNSSDCRQNPCPDPLHNFSDMSDIKEITSFKSPRLWNNF